MALRLWLLGVLLFGGLKGAERVIAQTVTISEINYKSDIDQNPGDWVELYNYGSLPVDISGWSFSDTGAGNLPYILPANTTLAAGAYLVLCRFSNFGDFLGFYSGVPNKLQAFDFKLNSTDQLNLSTASGTLVATVPYRDNLGWPKGADGEGRTLQLRNENSNTNLGMASSWRDGCMYGSPGAAPQADCNDPIIVSEINYNSDSGRDQGEFIELYNRTNSPINLGGYFIRDKWDSVLNVYTFPAGSVLAPNGYVVVSNDSAAFKTFHAVQAGKFFANFPYSLNNGGEVVRLYNANNVLLYSMHYNDSIPWTDSADGEGYTLEFKNYAFLCNEGTNWFAGCIGGSPFRAYTPTCSPFWPVALQQQQLYEAVQVLPNPAREALHIHGLVQGQHDIVVADAVGQVLVRTQLMADGAIDIRHLPSGCYVLCISNGKQNISQKIIKQ